jgi:hypothetical protein
MNSEEAKKVIEEMENRMGFKITPFIDYMARKEAEKAIEELKRNLAL